MRLGDEVQVTALRPGQHLRQIESLVGDPLVAGERLDRRTTLREGVRHPRGRLVQSLPGDLAVFGVEGAEAALERAESRPLADDVVLDAREAVDGRDRADALERACSSLADLVDHRGQVKQRAARTRDRFTGTSAGGRPRSTAPRRQPPH